MKSRLRLLLLAGAFACLLPPRAHSQVVIIANPGIKSADISAADLRDLFTGTSSTLRGGATVAPVLLKQGNTHEEFLSHIVGKSDTAFRASWRSLVFSGQGAMPHTLDSEAAVVEYVAHTSGAIGYIARTTPHEGVKTLSVR